MASGNYNHMTNFNNFNWVYDSLIGQEVLDLYFILSDLVDIPISESETVESACLNSLCNAVVAKYGEKGFLRAIEKHSAKGMQLAVEIAAGVNSLPLDSHGNVDQKAYNADPGNTIPIGKLVL